MERLIDTNVLVYAVDGRSRAKQAIAAEILRRGADTGELIVPHQALIELVAVVSRPRADLAGAPLVEREAACILAEDLMRSFPVLYPDEAILTTAFHGVSTYGLSWFDAHLWAYAEANGIPEILSEDFEHGRHYGSVRVVDPFLSAADEVHELPPLYEEEGA